MSNSAQIFSRWRNLIVDMDGVLWQGDTPLPGLHEFFDALRSTGRCFVLATNNSTRTVAQYVDRLAAFGIQVAPEEVLTSAVATAQYLASQSGPGARVFAIGEAGVLEALRAWGLELAEEHVEYVVVGMDRQITWDKLARATLNVRAGATFVGTNPDRTYPTERGVIQGNGALLAALQAATDVAPLIVGKPEPILYRQALERLGGQAADTLVIGDRLDTDIAGAERAGLSSLLVMTGITTPEMAAASSVKATYTLPDLPAITAALLA